MNEDAPSFDPIVEECSSSCSGSEEPCSSSDAEEGIENRVNEAGPSSSLGDVSLASDPKLVINSIVSKFETEEALYMPFPGVTGTGKEVPVPSKLRKKREKRTPDVEGATLVEEKRLFDLRLDHFISDEVEFRIPTPEERASDPPPGYFTCILGHFELAYLWFPIPEIVIRFLCRYGLALSQMTPTSFRVMVALLVRSYEENMDLSPQSFRYLLKVVKGTRLNNHYVTSSPNYKFLSDLPGKDHYWENYYFFVKLNEAAVEGDRSLVVTQWKWKGRT